MMRRLTRWLSLGAALLLPLTASRAGTLQLLDGTFHEGTVSLDRGIAVRGNTSAKVALGQVLFARFSDEAPSNLIASGVVLTNGTRIAGQFTSLFENPVTITGKGARLPSGDIALGVFQPFDAALIRDLPAGKTGALLPGGDFFEGTVKSADSRSARILNSIFGPKVFTAASKQAHAVVLRGMTMQPAAFEVITRDGSRYLAIDVVVEDTASVLLRHPHYDGLRIPAAELVEIRAAPSRILDLSLYKPTRVTGEFSNANADGSRLRIGTQVVTGCSMAAGASATWRRTIRGGVFTGRIAPGLETGATSNLIFIAEADGRPIFRSPPTAPGTPAQPIRFIVPPTESLTFRIEGQDGRGVWADPLIVLR